MKMFSESYKSFAMTTNTPTALPQEIGGYFELELPNDHALYPEAVRFQSARSAMRAVLGCDGIDTVYMPSYICDSIIRSGKEAGVTVHTYGLTEHFLPKQIPDTLPQGTVLLYVNYFGLCDDQIQTLLSTYPKQQMIIDNSQALFAKHTGCLASVYSPRKFVGLPDGGLVIHSPALNLQVPEQQDQDSIERVRHLLLRTAYPAESGYEAFVRARDSLNGLEPMRMSKLTERLMLSVPWSKVLEQRRRNHQCLHAALESHNTMPWRLAHGEAPLCYPLVLKNRDVTELKQRLIERKIFTATYWPDVKARAKKKSVEHMFLQQTLFLPIDQRLNVPQTQALSQVVLDMLSSYQ